jgi:hypothetical protein
VRAQNRALGAKTNPSMHAQACFGSAQAGSPTAQAYSSNSSGPKTEIENAHVDIPTSNCLFFIVKITIILPKSGGHGWLKEGTVSPSLTRHARVGGGVIQ